MQAGQLQGYVAADLPPLVTLEDAKLALDAIRVGVLTRRITGSEATAGSKAVAEWVRTETASITARLVGELRQELERKAKEIEALRKQLVRK